MATPRETGEKFIVLFDFDETLAQGDSDELVSRYIGKGAEFEAAYPLYNTHSLQWTNTISSFISTFTREELTAAIGACLRVSSETIAALRMLHELSSGENPMVEYGIVSDANSLFIDEAFKQIIKLPTPKLYTNHYVDLRETPEGPGVCPLTGKPTYSKLTWCFPNSHDCERCKVCPNMCKSAVTERALANSKLRDPTVIFCGDGFNDSCPMQKVLRLRDHMFVRRGFRLERIVMDPAEAKGVCHHHFWHSGDELASLMQRVVGDGRRPSHLPPIVCFNDVGASEKEFRAVTLSHRIPALFDRLISEANDDKSLRAALVRMRSDITACVNEDVLVGEGSLTRDPNYLPVPFTLLVYGHNWRQLPWLQGEIYLNVLLWHIVHRVSSATAVEMNAIGTVADFSVNRYQSWALPTPKLEAHDVFLNSRPIADMYLEEKSSVTQTFLVSHIRPMVAQVEGFLSSLPERQLENPSDDVVGTELRRLLSACVWGNTVDLSMFNRSELLDLSKQADSPHAGHVADHTLLDSKVVANDMDAAAKYLLSRLKLYAADPAAGPCAVDIVMDNMGVECAADMLLGTVLASLSGNMKVRFHTKPIPYYVSDVMPKDIHAMLVVWEADASTSSMAERFRTLVASGHIEIHTHPYWVHPSEYREMPSSVVTQYFFSKRFATDGPATGEYIVGEHETINFGLVKEIIVAKTDLVIFKGDLNFRRVCGDRHWTPDMFFYKSRAPGSTRHDGHVPFTTVLSDYWPYAAVPVLALRTNKSEITVGPTSEQIAELDAATDGAWRCNGQYASAVFAN